MKKLLTIWMIALAVCAQAWAQEPADLIAISDAAGAALNAHDVDQMASYWADDIVYNYLPLPVPLEGKEAVRAFKLDLPTELLDKIEIIHEEIRNPCCHMSSKPACVEAPWLGDKAMIS